MIPQVVLVCLLFHLGYGEYLQFTPGEYPGEHELYEALLASADKDSPLLPDAHISLWARAVKGLASEEDRLKLIFRFFNRPSSHRYILDLILLIGNLNLTDEGFRPYFNKEAGLAALQPSIDKILSSAESTYADGISEASQSPETEMETSTEYMTYQSTDDEGIEQNFNSYLEYMVSPATESEEAYLSTSQDTDVLEHAAQQTLEENDEEVFQLMEHGIDSSTEYMVYQSTEADVDEVSRASANVIERSEQADKESTEHPSLEEESDMFQHRYGYEHLSHDHHDHHSHDHHHEHPRHRPRGHWHHQYRGSYDGEHHDSSEEMEHRTGLLSNPYESVSTERSEDVGKVSQERSVFDEESDEFKHRYGYEHVSDDHHSHDHHHEYPSHDHHHEYPSHDHHHEHPRHRPRGHWHHQYRGSYHEGEHHGSSEGLEHRTGVLPAQIDIPYESEIPASKDDGTESAEHPVSDEGSDEFKHRYGYEHQHDHHHEYQSRDYHHHEHRHHEPRGHRHHHYRGSYDDGEHHGSSEEMEHRVGFLPVPMKFPFDDVGEKLAALGRATTEQPASEATEEMEHRVGFLPVPMKFPFDDVGEKLAALGRATTEPASEATEEMAHRVGFLPVPMKFPFDAVGEKLAALGRATTEQPASEATDAFEHRYGYKYPHHKHRGHLRSHHYSSEEKDSSEEDSSEEVDRRTGLLPAQMGLRPKSERGVDRFSESADQNSMEDSSEEVSRLTENKMEFKYMDHKSEHSSEEDSSEFERRYGCPHVPKHSGYTKLYPLDTPIHDPKPVQRRTGLPPQQTTNPSESLSRESTKDDESDATENPIDPFTAYMLYQSRNDALEASRLTENNRESEHTSRKSTERHYSEGDSSELERRGGKHHEPHGIHHVSEPHDLEPDCDKFDHNVRLPHYPKVVPPKSLQVGSLRGVPGVHFPDYREIPITSFSCADKPYIPGFYADLETGCQVFHVCWPHRRESFLCPVGTIFNQPILACDYWYNGDCSLSPKYFDANDNTHISEQRIPAVIDHFEEHKFIPEPPLPPVVLPEPLLPPVVHPKHPLPKPHKKWSKILKFLPVVSKVTVYPEYVSVADANILKKPKHVNAAKGFKLLPKTKGKGWKKAFASEIIQEVLGAAEGLVGNVEPLLSQVASVGHLPRTSVHGVMGKKQIKNPSSIPKASKFSRPVSQKHPRVPNRKLSRSGEAAPVEDSALKPSRPVRAFKVKTVSKPVKEHVPEVVMGALEMAGSIFQKDILPFTREALLKNSVKHAESKH